METQPKKPEKDCPKEKPLYNPKTKRCIKDTNANRERIEKTKKELEQKKKKPSKKSPIELKISENLEELEELPEIEELEELPEIEELEELPEIEELPEKESPKKKKKIKKTGKITLKMNTLNDIIEGLKRLDKKEKSGDFSEKNEKTRNILLNKKEIYNREALESADTPNFLFPNKDDPNFNIKLIEKKEFNVLKKRVITDYDDLENLSEEACNRKIFELLPHQIFVKNFLSFQTPYNSLLLYHGLGTGKTCSAISICEEMRDYLKQMDIDNRIIVIASPNVQENFKLQLTNFNKLKNIKGIWDLNACVGNKFLKKLIQ